MAAWHAEMKILVDCAVLGHIGEGAGEFHLFLD